MMSERRKVVYEYTFDPSQVKPDTCTISKHMPKDAQFLRAGVRRGLIALWYKIEGDNSERIVEKIFRCVPTARAYVHPSDEYLGTVLLSDGYFVLHIFEVTEL